MPEYETVSTPVEVKQWRGKFNELDVIVRWIKETHHTFADYTVEYHEHERVIRLGSERRHSVRASIEMETVRLSLEPFDYIIKMGPSVFACSKEQFAANYQKRSTT